MRVLITGGAGFIGSHIADELLRDGHDVRIIDSLEEPTHRGLPSYLSRECEFIRGDVRNPNTLRAALTGVDVVFHEAAAGGFTSEISSYVETNILGTARILELLREKGCRVGRIVLASSMAVYGEGEYVCENHGVVYPGIRGERQLWRGAWEIVCPVCRVDVRPRATREEKPVMPERPYSISKFAQERLVLSVCRELEIPAVALRFFLTYGPRQSIYNPYTGICSIFSTMILNGSRPTIFEDGLQTRDFVYVEDVARANLLVMKEGKADYQVFNVGTGRAATVLDLFNCLVRLFQSDVEPRISGHYRMGDVRHLFADIDKIRQIGFQATTTLEEGLEKYVGWISSMGDVREYFSAVEERLRTSGIIRSCRT